MLQEVIDLQNTSVTELLHYIEIKDEVTFKAPTGSGKTYMMADLMDRVLSEHDDVVFIVSSLSKGELAKQNYDKFVEYKLNKNFLHIEPFLINSENTGESRLFIPTDYNIYVLPRDLYKDKSKLKQGAFVEFLFSMTTLKPFGCAKKIFLIKDECHIATSNLDSLREKYFSKVLNFSATPKKEQKPDVELKEEDAIQSHLIKKVEYQSEHDTLDTAINKFKSIKKDYHRLLGINPCMIIQISNKEKADEEIEEILNTLSTRHSDLKWMLIVDDDRKCDTNDAMKIKGLPVPDWKKHAKTNTSLIDIIIFKMVITEGWDIPRACMLYQIRNAKSEQLTEQVVGRVRRNPMLTKFEKLSQEAQTLISVAYIWGVKPKEQQQTHTVKLADLIENSKFQKEIKLNTTCINAKCEKKIFDVADFIKKQKRPVIQEDIFSLYNKLKKASNEVKALSDNYVTNYSEWYKFMNNIESINKKTKEIICDYKKSMYLLVDENGEKIEKTLPLCSFYTDNEHYVRISNWIWMKDDNENAEFSFDSIAEQEWAQILVDLTNEDAPTGKGRIIKDIVIKEKMGNDEEFVKRYLFGKNYLSNSGIKFEYYLDGIHSSYPDFIMKDYKDRIHLFETKSVNKSSEFNFNEDEYNNKVNALKECYKQSSILTGYYFYLPIKQGSDWQIFRYVEGIEDIFSKSSFIKSLKK